VAGSDDLYRRVVGAIADRSADIIGALGSMSEDALLCQSDLPGWSRLTITCHLRYGAEALNRMTRATLAGEPAAYYPQGRAAQRPATLVPLPGEQPAAAVASLARRCAELQDTWAPLPAAAWSLEVAEPSDNADLGSIDLGRLPLLRLTEVEVHGSDLGLRLPDWSEHFVRVVLPMRLHWLNVRRANHRRFDATLNGAWLLVASDGPVYRVRVNGTEVESRPAEPTSPRNATIEATSRDLLALLLGRPFRTPPVITGDVRFGEAFASAFPGP
jgi:uncharacterized protein (TIGR03083 family)